MNDKRDHDVRLRSRTSWFAFVETTGVFAGRLNQSFKKKVLQLKKNNDLGVKEPGGKVVFIV
ncbi:hypothetical protein [Novipirellula maiorica]|uniref:hypothetical protein n=1 Tax=Novipirellula maiorica TaxID=1265734 RepID=UPI0003464398|nr:hypothetical protein [Rhodopirellula maiorica]